MLETMRTAVATGRAGTPVAARSYHEFSSDTVELDAELARAVDTLSQLFESPIASLTVFGSLVAGQLSSLVRFSHGQSALVAVASRRDRPRAECFVFADRGTLHWERSPGSMMMAGVRETRSPKLSAAATELRVRIQHELARRGLEASDRPFPEPGRPRPCAPPYGILLVSGDHTHQPGYAAALVADPRCRLVAVSDESDVPERRRRMNRQLGERLGIPYVDDLETALARDDIHIVSVCAEPYRRGRIIVQAARAGKHLYLDKPLCGSRAEADAIVAAVRDAGVVAHMFSQVCFAPALTARRRVASGQLGDLIAIHADLCFAKGHAGTATLGTPRVESAQPDRYELVDAKREMTNVGVYQVVLLLWLTQRRVRRVAATTGNYFFAEHQTNGMEDFGQILLELDGGMTATISSGRLGWKSHPSGGLNRTTLVGRHATSVVDAHAGRVEMWTAAEPWQPPERNPEDPMGMWQAPPGDPYQAEPKLDWIVPGSMSWQLDSGHFLDCIEQGRVSDVPVELAAAATEVLLAAYRAAATASVVNL